MKAKIQFQIKGAFTQVLKFNSNFNHTPEEILDMFQKGELLTTMNFYCHSPKDGLVMQVKGSECIEVGTVLLQEQEGEENEILVESVQVQ